MAFPPLDPAELARRLGLPAAANSAQLTTVLAVAASMLAGRVDPVKVEALPDTYLEAGYQLGVKVWETGTRGMVGMDTAGSFDLTPQATAGMWRAVLGIAQPVLKTGGMVIG